MSLRSPSIRRRPLAATPNRSMPNGRIAGSTAPSSTSSRDRVGGDRREQNAVAMMAGGVDQAVDRPGPRIGASSRLPGRCPTHISSIGSSSTAGTARQAASSSVSRPPAVSDAVESLLLDGRADQQAAVEARHQIGARRPDHMVEERRGRIHAQRQHLAFDRPHRRPQLGRKPRDRCATRRRRPARPRRPQPCVPSASTTPSTRAPHQSKSSLTAGMLVDAGARRSRRQCAGRRRACGCRPGGLPG